MQFNTPILNTKQLTSEIQTRINLAIESGCSVIGLTPYTYIAKEDDGIWAWGYASGASVPKRVTGFRSPEDAARGVIKYVQKDHLL